MAVACIDFCIVSALFSAASCTTGMEMFIEVKGAARAEDDVCFPFTAVPFKGPQAGA